jgi:hypothetical protein
MKAANECNNSSKNDRKGLEERPRKGSLVYFLGSASSWVT